MDKLCIWAGVYERAKDAGRIGDLAVYIPPPDWAERLTTRESATNSVERLP